MCGGGSPAPAPEPVRSTASTAQAGQTDQQKQVGVTESDMAYARKLKMGKRRMRIPTKNGANVPTDGSGLNIPQG